eukprot:scaffold93367_cov21-Tisochrysis_lutea.AAC.3
MGGDCRQSPPKGTKPPGEHDNTTQTPTKGLTRHQYQKNIAAPVLTVTWVRSTASVLPPVCIPVAGASPLKHQACMGATHSLSAAVCVCVPVAGASMLKGALRQGKPIGGGTTPPPSADLGPRAAAASAGTMEYRSTGAETLQVIHGRTAGARTLCGNNLHWCHDLWAHRSWDPSRLTPLQTASIAMRAHLVGPSRQAKGHRTARDTFTISRICTSCSRLAWTFYLRDAQHWQGLLYCMQHRGSLPSRAQKKEESRRLQGYYAGRQTLTTSVYHHVQSSSSALTLLSEDMTSLAP